MATQHQAIDLTSQGSILTRFKRKPNYHERLRLLEASNAMDALLGDRLKKLKSDEGNPESDHAESKVTLRKMELEEMLAAVPTLEWWDQQIVSDPKAVSHLVEHPIPLKGITGNASKQAVAAKAILTPAEREKLRKLRRKEQVQDMQDKIKMGLIRPPPPKIKMKNLMRVLGKEAVAEPSAVEQTVRAQVDERIREHERRNEERKLSPEERRAKTIAKWTRPLERASALKISAYFVTVKLTNRMKFKINRNAEQLHLGGLLGNSRLRKEEGGGAEFYPSIVVVEGAKRAVKKFDRLMLNRIDWHEKSESSASADQAKKPYTKDEVGMEDEQSGDDDESEDEDEKKIGGDGACVRIFHGSDSKKIFSKWMYADLVDLSATLALLEEKNCIQYWNMIARYRNNDLDF